MRHNLDLPEDGLPLWEWLAADARVPASQLGEWQRLYERTRAGKSVDLVRLHNLLTGLRGTLE
jgi:spore germination protein YaaH